MRDNPRARESEDALTGGIGGPAGSADFARGGTVRGKGEGAMLAEDESGNAGTSDAARARQERLWQAQLDRERATATRTVRFPGPGASDAAALPGGTSSNVATPSSAGIAARNGDAPTGNETDAAADLIKTGIDTFVDQVLWKSVWEDFSLLSLLGINLHGAVYGVSGWPIWKQIALLALDLLVVLLAVLALGLVCLFICMLTPTCRSDVLPWYLGKAVGVVLWFTGN